MPTDQDKNTAGLPDEGEAHRLSIRRARYDRDGLYLFGRRHAAQTCTLTPAELTELRSGKTIAVDIHGEYILYIRLVQ